MKIKIGDKVLAMILRLSKNEEVVLYSQLANGHYLASARDGTGDIIEIAREDILKIVETREERKIRLNLPF